jgi:hypothetical protein
MYGCAHSGEHTGAGAIKLYDYMNVENRAALQQMTCRKKTRSHRDANGLKPNPQMSPHFQ